MIRHVLILFLGLALIFQTNGCGTAAGVAAEEYRKDPRDDIAWVELLDGSVVEFDTFHRESGCYENSEIVGVAKSGKRVRIPIATVKTIHYAGSPSANSANLEVILFAAACVAALAVGIGAGY